MSKSVGEVFLDRIKESQSATAFQYPKGESDWQSMTWGEMGDRVRNIACGLLKLGLKAEERAAVLSNTRLEWVLADLGIMTAAGATTTIYPSNTGNECTYIIVDSETRFVFAEDDEQVDKLVAEKGNIPGVANVITFTGKAGHDGWVITLDELEKMGAEHHAANPELWESTIGACEPEHLATLIYTSGTTGEPKGVELTHDCWVYEGTSLASIDVIRADDHQYLWLPLSHSFGKVLLQAQLQIGFKTTIDGRIPKLVENLGVIKPTFMAAAPRIFEKVYNKVVSGAQSAGGLKYKIFTWAVGVGEKVSAKLQKGEQPGGALALQYALATKLVFSKLQALFGGNIRFFVSGSAPLNRAMAEFFHAAGILILEGYGLTETSAASFVNRPNNYAFGTVGIPLPGTEVKIADEDGEILMRGRGIMRGYRNKPEQTAEVLVEDGWLRTGDIGELDSEGRLKITDRKKDLIKTSGGKYVAPQHLEGKLKSLCPYVSQVLVHGNNRNFCTALVTIDPESIEGWKAEQGLDSLSYEELTKSNQIASMVQTAVDELNSDLPSYETIKKFAILPEDLSIEAGELTPSLKVKRKVVEGKYKGTLDGFYEGQMAQM